MIANPNQPVALSIAGSDSSGGAGIQADLKTFTRFGVDGATAITAVTAQNTRGVIAVELLSPDLITKQIEAVAQGAIIAAIKTGMLGDGPSILAVAKALETVPRDTLIIDPVMVATSGARLQSSNAVHHLKEVLLPVADLMTPNLDEAAVLLDTACARTRDDMESQAQALSDMFQTAVLLTGGHLHHPEHVSATASDVLVSKGHVRWFEAPYVAGADTHGTGCTLSAAITAASALGHDLDSAITQAKAYVHGALQASSDQA